MHWFDGSIAEAVTLSKQKNAIFVVFVEGDNELSTEMAATIDKDEVLQRLSNQSNFLAIKLNSGTVNYSHFAQLYQLVPVPSLFFIGRNGTPLEVVCAGVQPDNLAARIDRILREHHKDKPPSITASTSFTQARNESANLLLAEASSSQTTNKAKPDEKRSTDDAGLDTPATATKIQKTDTKGKTEPVPSDQSPTDPIKASTGSTGQVKDNIKGSTGQEKDNIKGTGSTGQEYEVVCQGDVCVRRVKDAAGPSQTTTPHSNQSDSTTDIEDKLQRAKQLIEAKNKERLEKEKQLEVQKELERRAAGQGVAELKKWQADQELKQIQEERKREKMENNLARQRVLDQIAQDRAERRARDMPAPTVTAPRTPTANNTTFGDSPSSGTRVSLKLPDGGSHTASFNADDTLDVVYDYIINTLHISVPFTLWSSFPRREFPRSGSTLLALQLVPSAALLVLHTQGPVANNNSWATVMTFLTQLFTTMILDPANQLYTWFRSRFPDRPTTGSGDRTTGTTGTSTNTGDTTGPNPGPYRRKNNVHRLARDSPNNDDNNTWNGNSTQQM